MPIADNGVDYVSAPENYADLFTTYYTYVVCLVRKMGIDSEHSEDVASEILLRFYERDFLAKFDPTLVFEYEGQKRPARFKSFLTRFVMVYVRGMWDKQQRIADRELMVIDAPNSEGDTSSWLDVFGATLPSHEQDVLNRLDEENVVRWLRHYLACVPRRSNQDSCDLVMLFDEVMRQIRKCGHWNVVDLQDEFGLSSTAMHAWMWWLRTNLAEALNKPAPPKRIRTMKVMT